MILSNLKHWAKFTLQQDYRETYKKKQEIKQELERIKTTPRYSSLSTNLFRKPITVIDGLSFFYSYKEIFQQGIYYFKTSKKNPIIIDAGSNIGLSIIYFKELYPNSKIWGFEADPKVFEVLSKNLEAFGYSDITLNNKAVWHSETMIEFAVEGADGGRVALNLDRENSEKVQVQTVRLSDYLKQPIDFLKIDIEGAEVEVVIESANYLKNVDKIFIEYHSFLNEEQRLDELLAVLKASGFRTHLKSQFISRQPYIEHPVQLGMDNQLNVFAYR